MTQPVRAKLLPSELRERRAEVERCLAECGLGDRPSRATSGDSPAAVRLRNALDRLGPVFRAFGYFLSARIDALMAGVCRELASLSDRAPATPLAAVNERIAAELGCLPALAFRDLSEEPFESRVVFQRHHARLPNGKPVIVKVVHPDVEERIVGDLAVLPVLGPAFAAVGCEGLNVTEAAAEFGTVIKRQAELQHEAEALRSLAHDGDLWESVAAPAVYSRLSSAGILTTARPKGRTLAEILASADGDAVRPMGRRLATLLCTVWLRQALLGQFFNAEPEPQNVLVHGSQRIVFAGSAFTVLPVNAKQSLFDYLTAVATRDPDRACACLLREMKRGPRAGDESELRLQLRQAVPFREGAGLRFEGIDSLAEQLFLQWHLARLHGYQPMQHLAAFCRGLTRVTIAASQLAPGHDALREALENARLAAAWGHVRQMLGTTQVDVLIEKYGPLLLDLPRKLDEVATLAAEGGAWMRLRMTESGERRRQKNVATVLAAVVLLLAGVGLVGRYLLLSGASQEVVLQLGVAAFALAAVVLLGKRARARG